jgi:hypothetical protein
LPILEEKRRFSQEAIEQVFFKKFQIALVQKVKQKMEIIVNKEQKVDVLQL